MAAAKTQDAAGVKFHFTDAHGNHAALQQLPGAATVQVASNGAVATLTKQNVTDLLSALTAFSNTGVLS